MKRYFLKHNYNSIVRNLLRAGNENKNIKIIYN